MTFRQALAVLLDPKAPQWKIREAKQVVKEWMGENP